MVSKIVLLLALSISANAQTRVSSTQIKNWAQVKARAFVALSAGSATGVQFNVTFPPETASVDKILSKDADKTVTCSAFSKGFSTLSPAISPAPITCIMFGFNVFLLPVGQLVEIDYTLANAPSSLPSLSGILGSTEAGTQTPVTLILTN